MDFSSVAPGLFVYGKVGRGLGLTAVFGVVRQHEGMIQVFSKPGEGSMFQFFRPVASDGGANVH